MTITLGGITLPDDIQWVDEFAGHGVGQIITPTLTGALVVEETAQPAGRPITLDGRGHSWMTRAQVEALHALAATPLAEGATLTLAWADGRNFSVAFDRSRGGAVSAEEVMRRAPGHQDAGHFYAVKIHLITA